MFLCPDKGNGPPAPCVRRPLASVVSGKTAFQIPMWHGHIVVAGRRIFGAKIIIVDNRPELPCCRRTGEP